MFWKPRPEYARGDLVDLKRKGALPNGQPQPREWLLIRTRRWICPHGEMQKRWVYDGIVLRIVDGEIKIATYISCVFEQEILGVVQ